MNDEKKIEKRNEKEEDLLILLNNYTSQYETILCLCHLNIGQIGFYEI